MGLPLVCHWYASGMPLVCLWDAPGRPLSLWGAPGARGRASVLADSRAGGSAPVVLIAVAVVLVLVAVAAGLLVWRRRGRLARLRRLALVEGDSGAGAFELPPRQADPPAPYRSACRGGGALVGAPRASSRETSVTYYLCLPISSQGDTHTQGRGRPPPLP